MVGPLPINTARGKAIRSVTARPALTQLSSSTATAISTRSMRVGWYAPTPSPLARAASEPTVRYECRGQTFTLHGAAGVHGAPGGPGAAPAAPFDPVPRRAGTKREVAQ